MTEKLRNSASKPTKNDWEAAFTRLRELAVQQTGQRDLVSKELLIREEWRERQRLHLEREKRRSAVREVGGTPLAQVIRRPFSLEGEDCGNRE